jgi:pyruvate-formate lyase
MRVPAQSSDQSPSSPCWVPSERILQLAAEHNRAVPAVGAERAIHYTDFYKNEAQRYATAHQVNAHSLAYHLRHRTVRLYDNERIVGTHTEHRIGAICQIEKTGTVMLEDLFRFEKRAVNPLAIDPQVRWTLLRSVIPYWLNRNIIMRSFPWLRRLRFAKEQLSATWFTVNEAGGIAHFLPDYESIIQLGTEGLRARVMARQAAGSLSEPQKDFLDASLVALSAIEMFADRYRMEAEDQGRADLVALLENCPRCDMRNQAGRFSLG